jgi:ABC-type phosphate transport system permease subunit
MTSMDTYSTPKNKIRKARIRIVVYVLMLMILQAKIKICTMVKYKRYGSLTFTVSRFLFSVVTELMQPGVLYKKSTGSLVLTLTVKDISQSLSC